MPPARRAAKTLRVRSRFTPTRTSVYRLGGGAGPPGASAVDDLPGVPPTPDHGPGPDLHLEPVEPETPREPETAREPEDPFEPEDPPAPETGPEPQAELPPDTDSTPEATGNAEPTGLAALFPPTERGEPAALPAPARRAWSPARRGTVFVVAAALVALAVVLAVRGLGASSGPAAVAGSPGCASPSSSGSAPVPPDGLAGWLADGGPGTRVAVDDATTAGMVTAAGGTPSVVGLTAARPGDRVVRAADPTDPADVTAVVTAAPGTAVVPVRRFPSDNGTTLVGGVVVTGSAADVTAARSDASATARLATAALARNAAVTFSPTARAVLDAGDVDVRLSAFIATLAEEGTVQVTGFGVDDAERAAGVPVRVVTVSAPAADRVSALVALARGPFAPVASAAAGGGTTLTWALAPDPTDLTVR